MIDNFVARARKETVSVGALLLALGLALNPGAANAQEATESDEIIVTGTRTTGLRAADSPAPIVVLGAEALSKVAQPDLIQALAQNIPSFTAQAFGGDTAALTLSAKLRGLSPNHTLVLINGKRRHTTANLAVLGGAFQGGAAADLNFIPVSSIERIEVLQEGAAAQYGTDAIAGVVNIILKDDPTGGSIIASGGEYFDEGGETGDLSVNFGFAPIPNSYVNLTAETKYHGSSDRGGIDPRVVGAPLAAYPAITTRPDYPYVNHILGDPQYQLNIVSFNAGVELPYDVEFYMNGSYGHKRAQAFENYRTPTRVVSSTGVRLFPLGFNPQEQSIEDDFSIVGGFKGTLAGWNWDATSSYGEDQVTINTIKSANASLYFDTGFTPTNFNAGAFNSSQWTNTLDVSHEYDVGLAGPLNVALGVEYRRDTYEVAPGDAAARYKEGSQSFPGFALTDAGSHSRNSKAVYVDLAVKPIENLQIDVAARYEDFSDFGNTTVGKATARYDFTDAFAIRGTASTGFRAPTLAESFYSATNVSPTQAFVQLPPNSAAASLVGVNGLDPEKSTNYSIGFVAHPISKLTATFDLYQIKIEDRIVGSGQILGTASGVVVNPAVVAAITANGNVLDSTVRDTGISLFANGLDTETKGAELVITYSSDFGAYGDVDWSISGNYTTTEVTRIAAPPAQLAGAALYDTAALSYLEDTAPEYRIVLGGLWSLGKFTTNLRGTYYGPSSEMETPFDGNYYKNNVKQAFITDVDLSYSITDNVTATIGANNLFNVTPDLKNSTLLAIYRANTDNSAVNQYPNFTPYGINGGYYFGKLKVEF